jgi:hypothetical protein
MKLRMVLKIDYEPADTPVSDLKRRMEQVVSIGMGDGIFTGETEAEIDEFSVNVEEVTYDGAYCPACGSSEITGGDLEPEGAEVYRNCSCNNCGSQWTEEYEVARCDNLLDEDGHALPDFQHGQNVWWTDPDNDLGSGAGTVTLVREDMVCLAMHDGSEVEAPPNEIKKY